MLLEYGKNYCGQRDSPVYLYVDQVNNTSFKK